MNILGFIKKHPVASLSMCLGVVAVVVSATSFITYSVDYSAKAAQASKDREELKAKLPKLPEEVLHDNEYFVYDDEAKTVESTKSSFKNSYVFEAEAATITLNDAKAPATYVDVEGTSWKAISGLGKKGGTISYAIETESYGSSDIDIVLASAWKNSKGETQAIDNVSDYIKIEINGLLVKTEEFELPDDGEYQHLILKSTHLMAGMNTLNIKSAVYNTLGGDDLYVMPDVRNVTVQTNVNLVAAE